MSDETTGVRQPLVDDRRTPCPRKCRCCRCATRSCSRIRSCRSPWRARAPSNSSTRRSPAASSSACSRRRTRPTKSPVRTISTRSAPLTHIHKMFKLPDGSLRLIVQGLARIRLVRIAATQPYLRAEVVEEPEVLRDADALEVDALQRNIRANFQQVVQLSPRAVRRSDGARREHHRARAGSPISSRRASARSARRSNRNCSRRSTSARGSPSSIASSPRSSKCSSSARRSSRRCNPRSARTSATTSCASR